METGRNRQEGVEGVTTAVSALETTVRKDSETEAKGKYGET